MATGATVTKKKRCSDKTTSFLISHLPFGWFCLGKSNTYCTNRLNNIWGFWNNIPEEYILYIALYSIWITDANIAALQQHSRSNNAELSSLCSNNVLLLLISVDRSSGQTDKIVGNMAESPQVSYSCLPESILRLQVYVDAFLIFF